MTRSEFREILLKQTTEEYFDSLTKAFIIQFTIYMKDSGYFGNISLGFEFIDEHTVLVIEQQVKLFKMYDISPKTTYGIVHLALNVLKTALVVFFVVFMTVKTIKRRKKRGELCSAFTFHFMLYILAIIATYGSYVILTLSLTASPVEIYNQTEF